jgi:hypothetical protein
MTTSGSTSWELTRNQIIEQMYAKLGIPGEGNTLTATQYTDGATALNAVIALAVTDGMPLWKRTTEALTLSTTSQVYTLSNAIKVFAVYVRDSDGVQYEIENKSLYDFNNLPRSNNGTPVHWTFQPSIQGGTISLWPLTSDSTTATTKTCQVVYQKEFDNFTASTETPDFPAYWTLALIYKTAVVLAPDVGLPLADRQELKQQAKEYWELASNAGDEDGSFYIQPRREM